VTRHAVALNPFASVRDVKHRVVEGSTPEIRADATIDSHWSNRIVPGGESRMSFEAKTPDLLWIG
jgi:hypothetical protein